MRPILATAFVLLVLPAAGNGQDVRIDALSLQSGAHARILGPTSDSRYTLITIGSTSADTLRYSLGRSSDMKSISWGKINRMDVSSGRHSNVLRGLGIGLLAGVVGGAIVGEAMEPGQDFTKGMDVAIAGVFFGFVGSVSGAAVGLAWRSEKWTPVTIPRGTDHLSVLPR